MMKGERAVMDNSLLHRIADGLEAEYPNSAELARDPDSDLRSYSLSVLRHYSIYRVRYLGPYHEVVYFVGFAENQPIYMLTGHPDAFGPLLRADGVLIQSAAHALECARAWIETTRDMRDLLYVVQSIDDLDVLPRPDAETEAEIAQCRADWADVIEPPRTADVRPPFTVRLFVAREQALERHTITVGEDATMLGEREVLADGLPLVSSR